MTPAPTVGAGAAGGAFTALISDMAGRPGARPTISPAADAPAARTDAASSRTTPPHKGRESRAADAAHADAGADADADAAGPSGKDAMGENGSPPPVDAGPHHGARRVEPMAEQAFDPSLSGMAVPSVAADPVVPSIAAVTSTFTRTAPDQPAAVPGQPADAAHTDRTGTGAGMVSVPSPPRGAAPPVQPGGGEGSGDAPFVRTNPRNGDACEVPVGADGKPIRPEALSLLLMVRNHLKGGVSPPAAVLPMSGDGDHAVPADSFPNGPFPNVSAPDGPAPALAPVVGGTAAIALPASVLPPSAPTDLSATLGNRMIDMGVSGQWIDGLARDIAGLSANGAQGRFQIDADHLGPVRVDIRQGVQGMSVSLTVATAAAETALRQDGDRLRLDAGLVAMRIADLRIERSAHLAENVAPPPSRDSQNAPGHPPAGPRQEDGGRSDGGRNDGAWAGTGQSAEQDRWRARENFAPGGKDGAGPSVSDPVDAREMTGGGPRRDMARARYA